MIGNSSLLKRHTTLLSAGPRAGKTTLLSEWSAAHVGARQYLLLTPEDEDAAFFLYRFLRDWPDVRARFEQLRAAMPQTSWGGLLGRAIAELQPDFCLLLDDFHAVERHTDWLALLRHFPLTGTLVVASRHRLPSLQRPEVTTWTGDDLGWTERPEREDLIALGSDLLAKAVAMHMVGGAAPSPAGLELIRRNVAMLAADGTHQLRAAWHQAASEAHALHATDSPVWTLVEAGLLELGERHLRTRQESRASRILATIPSEVRHVRPALLRLEGDSCFLAGQTEEARAYYLQALGLAPDQEQARALRIRLLGVAVRLQDNAAGQAIVAELDDGVADLPAADKARYLFWRALMRWDEGKIAEARGLLGRVLEVPPVGNRAVLYFHGRALHTLSTMYSELDRLPEALTYAQRCVRLSVDHHLHLDLLGAFALRLVCMLQDGSSVVPLSMLLDIPNDAFDAASPSGFNLFLTCFGLRAYQLGAYPLALRFLRLSLVDAQSRQLVDRIAIARYWLMHAHSRLGGLKEARLLFDEIRATNPNKRLLGNLLLAWCHVLVTMGQLAEASDLLGRETWESPEERARAHLYRLWVRSLEGDRTAADEARELLATTEGTRLSLNEAEIIEQLGIRKLPVRFHLQAFGMTQFLLPGRPAPRWPRRKALALLAHLALHPDGISSEALCEYLYQDSDTSDPSAALHSLAYKLRQVLSVVGAADLLDSTRGTYRFKWGEVAFCDLHEFQGLFRKAQSLERAGMTESAAIFFLMATMVARGPLFEDLGDGAFEEPQRALAIQLAHAQTFIEAHAPHLRALGGDAAPV